MRILVTGHKGFIGSRFFSLLKDDKYEVDGYDLGDDLPSDRYDFIVHLAARGLIRKSVQDPYAYFQDVMDLSMRVMEKARAEGSYFVFPSSGSTALPYNPYSISKKQIVEWIQLYRRLYGFKAFDLKFFNVYGPGSRKGGVYLFSRMALAGGPIEMLGDGEDIRDFVYIDDVVGYLKDIVDSKVSPGSYEIGTGVGTSIHGLAEKIRDAVGGHPDIVSLPDVIETAKTLVAVKPALEHPVSLELGIRKVIEFIKNDKSPKS